MDWSQHISESLPAPHDGEPSELRDDIRDELADHLACAVARELVKSPNEDAATKAALARFGDPRRIARQLWFDRMKERLMSQRLTLALVLVLALASMATGGLAWMAVKDGREAHAAFLQQHAEMMDRLLATQSAPAQFAAEPPRYLDWVPVSAELYVAEGEPFSLAEFEVSLSGNLLNDKDAITIAKQPDAENRIEFGFVRPGRYQAFIKSPWVESASIQVNVLPGDPAHFRFGCLPRREIAEIAFDIPKIPQLPADCVWMIQIAQRPRVVDGVKWKMPVPAASLPFPNQNYAIEGKTIIVTSEGKYLNLNHGFDAFDLDQPIPQLRDGINSRRGGRIYLDLALQHESTSTAVSWYAERFEVTRIDVLKRTDAGIGIQRDRNGPFKPAFVTLASVSEPSRADQPRPPIQQLTAVPGKNVWKIEAPAALVEQLERAAEKPE